MTGEGVEADEDDEQVKEDHLGARKATVDLDDESGIEQTFGGSKG